MNTVMVMADGTMNIAITELARDYSRTHETVVNTSFALPGDQEAQITEGAAADILITPRQQWIEKLKTERLIDNHSQTPLAKNQLVLVGPVGSSYSAKLSKGFPVADIIKQIGGEQVFVIGNPGTQMSGISGKEALRNLGVASDLEPYTLYIKSLDQMFDMVTNQHAYGIFLYSSTAYRKDIKIIDIFPKNSYKPIVYYAVILAGENMQEARKFLNYLKTRSARAIFSKNGFVID